MHTMNAPRLASGLVLFVFVFAASCTKESAAPAPAAPPPAAAVTPEMLAVLAKADAKDGATDKVVHRCAGCALGMDGKPEFALKVQDYTMHFCKAGCLEPFQGDPRKQILAMKVQ